jgi:hypothetical protein
LSNLCSESGHTLWALLLLQVRFYCPPRLCYRLEKQELRDEEDPELDESVDSTTEIATKIAHFSHEHHLKLTANEVQNNKKCHGCIRAIVPPCYSCAKCCFFLHTSCAKLPRKKKHPLYRHPLTLQMKRPMGFSCYACDQPCNGFTYNCKECEFNLDVQCGLISDILIHKGHEHRVFLSNRTYQQNCSSCDSKSYQVFHCTTCEFALDFKCATLPHTTRYKQHEHSFTLSYMAEDDSGEYYCDICEEERDPKHWFYYCEDCSYPAHVVCILGKYPKMSTLEVLTHLIVTHTSLLSLRKLKTALNVTNVAILAMRFSFNVPSVISTCTLIVYIKDKCGLGLRMSSLL